MADPLPHIAYMHVEADDLLRSCFLMVLATKPSHEAASDLMLRGTIPRKVIDDSYQNSTYTGPENILERFPAKRRVVVDSWSELLNLGAITYWFNGKHLDKTHWTACVGVEGAYRESSLREKYLGDGAVASRELKAAIIVQSCIAQNIRGKSAKNTLQQEVIDRLRDKLTASPQEPTRILAVTLMTENEDFYNLDFSKIARETIATYESTYGLSFCILMDVRPNVGSKPRVIIIPLIQFLPGGSREIGIIPSEMFMEKSHN